MNTPSSASTVASAVVARRRACAQLWVASVSRPTTSALGEHLCLACAREKGAPAVFLVSACGDVMGISHLYLPRFSLNCGGLSLDLMRNIASYVCLSIHVRV